MEHVNFTNQLQERLQLHWCFPFLCSHGQSCNPGLNQFTLELQDFLKLNLGLCFK